jgi:hypothetical protein
MRVLAFSLVAILTGCLRDTSFHCSTSDQCGAGGLCEATVGYCSFADPTCGRKYGPQSGSLAGQCVGNNPETDGGVDGPRTDASRDGAMIDGGPICPSDFVMLVGAPAQRRYKILTAANDWATQKTACNSAGAPHTFLGYPENLTELQAMDALAGTINTYWIGIDDQVTAGTWKNSMGATQTYLPWQGGSPSANPNDQCVEVLTQNTSIQNDRCNTNFPAMCECE